MPRPWSRMFVMPQCFEPVCHCPGVHGVWPPLRTALCGVLGITLCVCCQVVCVVAVAVTHCFSCPVQVSEGIDFADGRARCVMVVGIPYPHAKDSKVALKKDYNNATASASARAGMAAARSGPFGGSSSSSNGPPRLLTGDAWYSQQAFRALNQVRGTNTHCRSATFDVTGNMACASTRLKARQK